MEVNTRVQVEHTVTEELTGIDIVAEQIRLARGEKLSLCQKDVQFTGHVIQFRVNAEDPLKDFMPSPGRLEYYVPAGGPFVRVDSACYAGYTIPPNYDSMIAKLIVKGKNRQEAISRGVRALSEFYIGGVKTTIPFHLDILKNQAFLEADFDLGFVDQLVASGHRFGES